VELLGAYLNQEHCSRLFEELLALPSVKRPDPPKDDVKHARQLNESEQLELVQRYQAGEFVRDLASHFDISRNTVSAILKRHNIPTRWRKLDDDQIQQAIRLYESGQSEADVAIQFDVYPSAIHMILKRHGVPRRPNGTNQWTP
jgi:uncharacterized protein (DUF433 family)